MVAFFPPLKHSTFSAADSASNQLRFGSCPNTELKESMSLLRGLLLLLCVTCRAAHAFCSASIRMGARTKERMPETNVNHVHVFDRSRAGTTSTLAAATAVANTGRGMTRADAIKIAGVSMAGMLAVGVTPSTAATRSVEELVSFFVSHHVPRSDYCCYRIIPVSYELFRLLSLLFATRDRAARYDANSAFAYSKNSRCCIVPARMQCGRCVSGRYNAPSATQQ